MRRSVRSRASGVLTLLALAAAWSGPAAGQERKAEVPVEQFSLDNGMKFLLVPRPEQATVMGGWVARVGSTNERPGITGVAHFFEHMMFKGSRVIGTTDARRDAEIIAQQETLQDEIRALYAEQRRRYRRGEIDDPFDPAARPQPPGRPRGPVPGAGRGAAQADGQGRVRQDLHRGRRVGHERHDQLGLDHLLHHRPREQARALVLDGIRAAAATGLPRVLQRARRRPRGAPAARRLDPDRAIRRAAQRHVLDLAPVQVGHDRLDERPQDALARRCPGLLRDLLRAQQPDRRAGRQLRPGRGAPVGREVLRSDPARQEAGARRGHARGAAARREADERRVRLPAAGLDAVPHRAVPAQGRVRAAGDRRAAQRRDRAPEEEPGARPPDRRLGELEPAILEVQRLLLAFGRDQGRGGAPPTSKRRWSPSSSG